VINAENEVSVVVPAFNEERLLPGSLSAFAPPWKDSRGSVEVRADRVRQQFDDRTAEIARRGAQVVFEPSTVRRRRIPARALWDWIFSWMPIPIPGGAFSRAADAIRARCLAGEAPSATRMRIPASRS